MFGITVDAATSNQVYGKVCAPNFNGNSTNPGNTSMLLSGAAHDLNQAYLRAMLETPAKTIPSALDGLTFTPGL